MIYSRTTLTLAVATLSATHAFAPIRTTSVQRKTVFSANSRPRPISSTSLFATEDDEVERLRSMAAKLRSEAASLEAQKAQEIAEATERAFNQFDTNQDGEISLEELKAGLEKSLKTTLKDERVQQLMKEFDASGDGALQLDEFVGVNTLRNRLDAIVRDEKQAALDAKAEAKREAEAAALAQAKLEMINDKEPTQSDKLFAVLPYLFPLLDGLQFGRFLLNDGNNPIVGLLGAIYLLYRSVPFSGFIAFLALNVLSGNLGINRLVRFNMQQAIFLDIALFFPSLLTGLISFFIGAVGVQLPPILTQVGNDVIFVTLLATIGYATVSSLLGITPDKIPGISQAVLDRMPTIDMFDDEGKYIPRKDDDKKD